MESWNLEPEFRIQNMFKSIWVLLKSWNLGGALASMACLASMQPALHCPLGHPTCRSWMSPRLIITTCRNIRPERRRRRLFWVVSLAIGRLPWLEGRLQKKKTWIIYRMIALLIAEIILQNRARMFPYFQALHVFFASRLEAIASRLAASIGCRRLSDS